jgi:hypothetical protein
MAAIRKAILASMVMSLVVMYLLSTAYINETYLQKIQTLERDILVSSARYKDLYTQKISLEADSQRLMAQLTEEQEKAKLLNSKTKTSGQKQAQAVKTQTEPAVLSTSQAQASTTLSIPPTTIRVTRAS